MQDATVEGPYFLDTLEKAGFSVILDRWVCDRVLEDMSRADTLGSDLTFGINLNPESFADGEFVDYLIQQFTRRSSLRSIAAPGQGSRRRRPARRRPHRRPVVPGDQLPIEAQFLKERRGIAAFSGVATVDGAVVCSAELKCARREF